MMPDLNGVAVFAVVAETLSFRAAAERLGTSRSAVSQSIRRLESRMGVALVSRTTRSVRLTEAGERLYLAIGPAIAEVTAAVDVVGDSHDKPRGTLRLAVSSIAERFLSGPLLAAFLAAYPEIRIDITITDDAFDIVEHGFDAGVRLGEVIEQDMIAVPVSGAQRQIAVAAPQYIERHGAPRHPRDLVGHACIGWRPHPRSAPYRWEFAEAGLEFDVAVDPRMTTNEMGLMIKMACAGAGITCGMEETFRPFIARGELVPILEPFCPPFAGFFLCFPDRRNMPSKLRVLIDHLRYR
ncbi:LysR family transcriptional regulator [Bosea sp. (in: a-proteobacteria)]|uniref:LysR family transcriptional regulator n=1 Tax=Bosea sp. (in: a-proteobacteria) TaxID=1871050 RepID=UPI002B4A1DE9|nr:LysR family transcriptional regulator [Bosea sp. (in: a-proteobacteria)]WRH56716.1 MAG: LysR family transcriptional regulator [Bosea sp. (in: a-proteobacteria)]